MLSVSEYELITAARLNVLKRAIGALIVSHPDPGRFSQLFDAATGLAQIEHMTAPNAPASVREAATQLARELLDLAEDEVARRPPRTDGER